MKPGILSVMPTELDIAYAAGLYEGEGCASLVTRKDRPGSQASLAINMTDLEPLERFRDSVEAGTIYGPYPNPMGFGTKDRYFLRIARQADIARVGRLLYDWLSPRRRAQLDPVLEYVDGRLSR